MFDLISVGDVKVDFFFKISDAHLEKEKSGTEICLRFGDKLPVEVFQQCLGGNNGNNVVGAARLGMKSAVYANIGEDLMADFILAKLKEEGVDKRYIVVNKGTVSDASALINFQGERTILTYNQDYKYQLPDLDRAKWVYISSMGRSANESNFQAQVVNYLERTGANLVFNPGTYEMKFGVKKYPKLLSLTTLLIVNKEEAEIILGKKGEIKKMLSNLVELGSKMAIITDGKKGSFGYDGEGFYKLDVFPAKVVDMTGAGDAYATGVMAGLFHGKNLPEAMRWGAANGASVVESIGAQEGLLKYDKMQIKLKEDSEISARELK